MIQAEAAIRAARGLIGTSYETLDCIHCNCGRDKRVSDQLQMDLGGIQSWEVFL